MAEESSSKKEVGVLLKGLNWIYDKALDGVAGWQNVEEFSKSYTDTYPKREEAIESLIAWQISKAGVAGFVSGLGGVLSLPVGIPANLGSVLFIQLRMIASIAYIRGYDPREDQVRSLAYFCLVGSAGGEIAKEVGINIGAKLSAQAISRIPGEVIKKINQAVGFRLLTKAGTTGAVNLTKLIPVVGGLLSGAMDIVATRAIAANAVKLFKARPKRRRKSGESRKSMKMTKRGRAMRMPLGRKRTPTRSTETPESS